MKKIVYVMSTILILCVVIYIYNYSKLYGPVKIYPFLRGFSDSIERNIGSKGDTIYYKSYIFYGNLEDDTVIIKRRILDFVYKRDKDSFIDKYSNCTILFSKCSWKWHADTNYVAERYFDFPQGEPDGIGYFTWRNGNLVKYSFDFKN